MTRHRTDPVSLLFGLVFIAISIAAWSGLIRLDASLDLRWVWPTLLVAGGLTLLAGITRGGDDTGDPAPPVSDPEVREEEPVDADG